MKANDFKLGQCRNFCDRKCISEFRKKQVGKDSSRYLHGGKGTRLYEIWRGVRSRCKYKTMAQWNRYGGRGIKVCKEWVNDFETFRKWSIENGYGETLQIDRINNDGNYEPANCRWVTHLVNCQNRGTLVRTKEMLLEIKKLHDKKLSINSISKKLKISWCTAKRAIVDSGILSINARDQKG